MRAVSNTRQRKTADMILERSRYGEYLRRAVEAIFRPAERNGFWDRNDGRIIRALDCRIDRNGDLLWSADRTPEWRYAPFAAMGILRWRISSIADARYDEKIEAFLNYFDTCCRSSEAFASIPDYGLGPLMTVFSMAGYLYGDERYRCAAGRLHDYSTARCHFLNSEETLVLHGWCSLQRYNPNRRIRGDIENAVNDVLARQNKTGLFHFENSTTRNFQNQMYTLWALGKAAEVLSERRWLPHIESNLDTVIAENMLGNGAFVWEGLPLRSRFRSRLTGFIKGRTPAWRFLFSCHQIFFVHAVCQYRRAGGDHDYSRAVSRALNWLFGGNILGQDLVEYSGLGVPMRMMTPEGNLFPDGQRFIGAYEVGSYIMTLTELLESPDFGKRMSW